jgi:hypothetical protein
MKQADKRSRRHNVPIETGSDGPSRGPSNPAANAPSAEAPDSPVARPADEQIRMRAYEIYRERGGRVGDDMSDWLRAEREYLERAAAMPSADDGATASDPH